MGEVVLGERDRVARFPCRSVVTSSLVGKTGMSVEGSIFQRTLKLQATAKVGHPQQARPKRPSGMIQNSEQLRV